MKGTRPAQEKGLREVAVAAGVSVATVYRVASGSVRVSQEIQERVRDAAQKAGIELSRRNKPNVLAFLLSNRDMLHPFHSRILVGAEAACTARGWDMIFQLFRYQANVPWKQLHLPRILLRRDMVRAVVLAGTNSSNLLDLLEHREIPFAVLGNNVLSDGKDRQFDAVFSDDVQGAYEMTRYLQSLQHRNIWFVGNTALPWSARCFHGYEQAMKRADLPVHAITLESDNATEIGYLAAKSLFSRGEMVTAIVGASDETAQGVYKALKEQGVQIPENVSVAGCNDTFGSLLNPPLTTIREFPEQLGRRMVELVLNRLDDPGLTPQQVTIPVELVKRQSCGECPLSSAQERMQGMAVAVT